MKDDGTFVKLPKPKPGNKYIIKKIKKSKQKNQKVFLRLHKKKQEAEQIVELDK